MVNTNVKNPADKFRKEQRKKELAKVTPRLRLSTTSNSRKVANHRSADEEGATAEARNCRLHQGSKQYHRQDQRRRDSE
jgi:hypothetical protein